MATTVRPLNCQRIVRVPPAPPDQWIQNLLATTLAATLGPLTANFDWPNPIRPGQPPTPRVARSFTAPPGVRAYISQTDWPNPIRPVWREVGWTQSQIPPSPFAQTDWPNPVQLPWQLIRRTIGSSGRTSIGVVPTTQTDWPNPTRKNPSWLYLTQTGQGRVIGAPNPFATTDWPLPLRPPVYRPDVVTYAPTRVPPPVLPQIKQLDWPNPVRLAPPTPSIQPYWTPPQIAQNPFSLLDWPNPIRRLPSTLDVQPYWTRPAQNPLLPPNWANPQIVPWRPSTRVTRPGTSAPPPPPPVVPPFVPIAWPNPQRSRFSAALLGWEGILAFLGFARPDSTITDWPNPIRPVWRQTGYIQSQNPPIPSPVPFHEHGWTNPLRRRLELGWITSQIPPPPEVLSYGNTTFPVEPGRRLIETGFTDFQIPSTIPTGILPPIRQYDWPNPLRRQIRPDFITGQIPPPGIPFYQTAWPNPVLGLRREPGWFKGLPLLLGVPFAQTQWPNPLGRRLEPGWIQSQIPATPTPFPFNRLALPNRVDLRRGYRLPETGWIQSQMPPVPSGKPFVPVLWPNPILSPFPRELRSWLGILAYLGFDTQEFLEAFGDTITLSDLLQIAYRRVTLPPQNWINPPRLEQILWTPTFGATCVCGLRHVGPEGCNAVTSMAPFDAMTLSDALAYVYTPATPESLTAFDGSALEGFEIPIQYLTTDGAFYTGGSSSYTLSTNVRPNTGNYSLKATCTTSSSGEIRFGRKGMTTGVENWTYMRAYFYIESYTNTHGSAGGKHLFGWVDSSGYRSNAILWFPADGGLTFQVSHAGIPGFSGTTTSTIPLNTGVWYRGELVTEQITTGMTSTLYVYLGDTNTLVDKIQCHDTGLALGGFPFIASATATQSGNAITYLVDDWRVKSTVVSPVPAVASEGPLAGHGGVFMAYPIGADTSEWTPLSGLNFANVDEFPQALFDDDTSYISSSGSGQKTDIYTVAFWPNTMPNGIITCIDVRARTRTVPGSDHPVLKSIFVGPVSGTVYEGVAAADLTTSYLNYTADAANKRPHLFLEGTLDTIFKNQIKIGIRRAAGTTFSERVTGVWAYLDVQT